MTAQTLMNYLQDLKNQGNDLSSITINYRHDYDSDVEVCTIVEEDLFDEETNNILESIVLLSNK